MTQHPRPKLVVVTGGPGAGKTALLEVVRHHFCEHVVVLPEAASMLFLGGFPRHDTRTGRMWSQRAIWHVERSLEQLAIEEGQAAIVLCDRGTIDGVAYWPADATPLPEDMGTTLEAELARYASVIHLRTPTHHNGYNHQNPARRESAREAARIDDRILEAWGKHPNRTIVESTADFMEKVQRAVELIRVEVPECCRLQAPTL
ncbi:MAG: ATP-binding protein [Myxococcota bacterium]